MQPFVSLYRKGFTLVSFIVGISLLSFLSCLAVPNFQNSIAEHRARILTNALKMQLQLARTIAIAQHNTIYICPSKSGIGCDKNWHDTWMWYTKTQNEKTILKTITLPLKRATLRYTGFPNNNYIMFKPSGMHSSNGRFYYEDKTRSPSITRTLILNAAGRVRMED